MTAIGKADPIPKRVPRLPLPTQPSNRYRTLRGEITKGGFSPGIEVMPGIASLILCGPLFIGQLGRQFLDLSRNRGAADIKGAQRAAWAADRLEWLTVDEDPTCRFRRPFDRCQERQPVSIGTDGSTAFHVLQNATDKGQGALIFFLFYCPTKRAFSQSVRPSIFHTSHNTRTDERSIRQSP